MMLAVFALLAFALIFAWSDRKFLAVGLMVACLLLAIKQFLWEIHSPEYGYRMPWIQTELLEKPIQDRQIALVLSSIKRRALL